MAEDFYQRSRHIITLLHFQTQGSVKINILIGYSVIYTGLYHHMISHVSNDLVDNSYWFQKRMWIEFSIEKIEPENQNLSILLKLFKEKLLLKGELFYVVGKGLSVTKYYIRGSIIKNNIVNWTWGGY